MIQDQIIAYKEKISELRAKQLGHHYAEVEAAAEIQYHIKQQGLIEDEIIGWTYELDKLKNQLAREKSDAAWSIKKILG